MFDRIKIVSVDEFEPEEVIPVDAPLANIKVIGSGSGGTNAINHMIRSGLSGVEFIAVNTDKQHLDVMSDAEIKLHIGSKHTGGRGAGGDPIKGETAANEDRDLISEKIKNTDMAFLTTGMGGGTGTGSLPVIAKIAKDHGALTVAIVTTPFEVEGEEKKEIAAQGIKKLLEVVDTLIVIPNENLFRIIDRKTSVRQAFRCADDVLYQAVKGISDLITKTGLINTDFADVEATMRGQGNAHLGIGIGSGDNRAVDAANSAIDNPLLEDVSIEGATRLLINIAGPEEFPMAEVHEILNTIRARVGSGAKLKFGITFEPELGENVKVTVIATGFHSKGAMVRGEEMPKKAEADNLIIDTQRFDEIRGVREKRYNDNYIGIVKPKEYYENLDIPTAVRKYNPVTDSDFGGKVAGGRND
jgi:cell division protein FtsZ